jgi:small subunit ribosomal protein S4
MKLFLKGARCDTAKCAIERRSYPPGMQNWRRQKITPYGVQLREKQKVKRYYGLFERQFRLCFRRAERSRGNTGENLLLALESRLDNVLTLLGFASSRSQARQFILHGHIQVNGRKVTIPSQAVAPDDEIRVADRAASKAAVAAAIENTQSRGTPGWLEVISVEPPAAKVTRAPTREDVSLPVEEQLIVELLSK